LDELPFTRRAPLTLSSVPSSNWPISIDFSALSRNLRRPPTPRRLYTRYYATQVDVEEELSFIAWNTTPSDITYYPIEIYRPAPNTQRLTLIRYIGIVTNTTAGWNGPFYRIAEEIWTFGGNYQPHIVSCPFSQVRRRANRQRTTALRQYPILYSTLAQATNPSSLVITGRYRFVPRLAL
jgi:hypothetical protein